MNRILSVIATTVLIVTACSKGEGLTDGTGDGIVSLSVSIPGFATKAAIDGDGMGAGVNHWVVEIYDVQRPSQVFYYEEKDGDEGVLTQTFNLYLVKDQTYDIALWADHKGCYDTDTLSDVSVISQTGNKDEFDAFCYCIKDYTCTGTNDISAVLTRPMSQINFIATDLDDLETFSTPEAYASYEPVDFQLKIKVATSYDVYAGSSIVESVADRTITAKRIYGAYSPARDETTLYMAYVFTDAGMTKDVNMQFTSNDVSVSTDVTNVPVKRNYRTNIRGNFLTWKGKADVSIDTEFLGVVESDY